MSRDHDRKTGVIDAILDDDGAAVVVDDRGRCPECRESLKGFRVPMNVAELRYLGRRALAVAAALEGVPAVPEGEVYEEPFRRVWPPRMAVEVGTPDDLIYDGDLPWGARLLWIVMWRRVHIGSASPVITERASMLAHLLRVWPETVWRWLRALEARGWCSIEKRVSGPRILGSMRVELHVVRQMGMVDAVVVESPAQLEGGDDEDR